MDIDFLTWIGYLASITIAISMTLNSIVKFRWINLAGASLFSLYGFMIGSLPVALMNGFIVAVDVYYLILIYGKKEQFEILEVKPDSRYLQRFVDFHEQDIKQFFPGFQFKVSEKLKCYFTLRDLAVAGVFVAEITHEKTLQVQLDYVLPEYRDFKNGRVVFGRIEHLFQPSQISKIQAFSHHKRHTGYLKRMGFQETSPQVFEKPVKPQPHTE